MVAVAWKHPNVFIGVDNWHPRLWAKELVDFIAGPGRKKVLWGTNKPAVEPADSLAGVQELGFEQDVLEDLIYGNAAEAFGVKVAA
jgi:predicted TIM-barrel fold metal-dependent hydrolase